MRCARAYGNFCSQLISNYLHQFRCTSLYCSQKSHKITKILYFLEIIALLFRISLPWQQGSVGVKFCSQYSMAQPQNPPINAKISQISLAETEL